MKFSVRLLTRANADVQSIVSYIAERSPRGARHWNDAFESAIVRLEDAPMSCGLAPENEFFHFELREIPFRTKYGKPFRMVFRVIGTEVIVFRVRGHGQADVNPSDF